MGVVGWWERQKKPEQLILHKELLVKKIPLIPCFAYSINQSYVQHWIFSTEINGDTYVGGGRLWARWSNYDCAEMAMTEDTEICPVSSLMRNYIN